MLISDSNQFKSNRAEIESIGQYSQQLSEQLERSAVDEEKTTKYIGQAVFDGCPWEKLTPLDQGDHRHSHICRGSFQEETASSMPGTPEHRGKAARTSYQSVTGILSSVQCGSDVVSSFHLIRRQTTIQADSEGDHDRTEEARQADKRETQEMIKELSTAVKTNSAGICRLSNELGLSGNESSRKAVLRELQVRIIVCSGPVTKTLL